MNRPDPDDWFAEPEPWPPRRTQRPDVRAESASDVTAPHDRVDDWLGDDSLRPRGARDRFAGASWTTQTIVAGLVALVLILIALAAAGVFSSSSHAPTATRAARPIPEQPTTSFTPAPIPPAPTVTLKPGDSGTQVRRLQRALASLGYSVGKVDGDYGSATTQAVARFQRANNLTDDGIFGTATLAALRQSLNQSG